MTAPRNTLPWNVLAALAIAAGGFVLLTLTFVAFALCVNLLDMVFSGGDASLHDWVRALELGLFVLLVGGLSRWALNSGLGPLPKAVFLTVPVGVVYAALGVTFYRWPAIAVALGVVFFGVAMAYLRRSGRPWTFAYALTLVSLAMLAITVSGTDI